MFSTITTAPSHHAEVQRASEADSRESASDQDKSSEQ